MMNNIRKFYPMGLSLAAHSGNCSIEHTTDPVTPNLIPFLADMTEIGNKIQKLFAIKKDLYETALHIKHLIEQAPNMPVENRQELFAMAFVELEQQFPDQQEELAVVKHTIFKLN